MADALHIRGLSLWVAHTPLIQDLSLHVAPGEVLTIMGPSGSGKSTLLGWMVGDVPTAAPAAVRAKGELWLGERRIDTLPTEQRRVGILFQDDLLFAHLSVGQNLAFALPAHVGGKAKRRARVADALASVGLAGFDDRDPATLSGGQRARASLMRALLAEPLALLLDEPFAKLDMALRAQFRALVFQHVTERGIPTLLVTHDPADVPHVSGVSGGVNGGVNGDVNGGVVGSVGGSVSGGLCGGVCGRVHQLEPPRV
jgi:putative thiamine transport system ATP-binding protein